jgi:DNA repair protein RadC
MAKVTDLPSFKRPREKLFASGVNALKDYELLAIILRTGYKGKSAIEVAKRLLTNLSLPTLLHMDPNELAQLKGVGNSRAAMLAASVALYDRSVEAKQAITISSPEDVVKVVSFLRQRRREYMVSVMLNARRHLLGIETVSIGTLNSNLVHPRELFAPAIQHRAASIILTHNHPSGDSLPSDDDAKLTKRMVQAGDLLGIEVIDHIVVSRDGHSSLKELGMM